MTKADSIFDVRFGKDSTEVFSLNTVSNWDDKVLKANLTLEGGFLTLRGTNAKGEVVRKDVFNKKGPAV
ncbi:hypothetical protein PG984_016370 [Apiospora sp. TS-2023a]